MAKAKANDTWRVLPHRPIEKLSGALWRVEGDLEGMPLKRVMTIAKRSDGKLVVHNAMALDEASMSEIDAHGPVEFIVVPNGYHRLDAPVFHARYPAAKVLCPRGAKAKVEEVVPVSGSYEDFPADEAVRLETLDGTGDREGVMIVRSNEETTLVFNDAIFNMPHASGFVGFVLKHVTKSTGGPCVSRVAKLFVVKDKAAFRGHLERLSELPGLERILVSHHETIAAEARAVLRDVAASL